MTRDDFGVVCCDYVENMHEEGESRSDCGNLLSGLHHLLPALRRCMPQAWRLFGAWERCEVPTRALAISEPMMESLSGAALGR